MRARGRRRHPHGVRRGGEAAPTCFVAPVGAEEDHPPSGFLRPYRGYAGSGSPPASPRRPPWGRSGTHVFRSPGRGGRGPPAVRFLTPLPGLCGLGVAAGIPTVGVVGEKRHPRVS